MAFGEGTNHSDGETVIDMHGEQLLYTSCKRGIERATSGFQIYSYSAGMPSLLAAQVPVADVLSYQPPLGSSLPHLPTAEEAASLFPARYVFRFAGPERYLLSLISYIGRDYPEGSTRPGNFLGHVVTVPTQEMLELPYRYIGSPDLTGSIALDLVRSGDQPDLLPTVSVRPGTAAVDLTRLLADPVGETAVGSVVTAVVNSRKVGEASASRKLVVRADQEDFVTWIGAAQELLPRAQALQLGFSTYEWDPERSSVLATRALLDQQVPTHPGFTVMAPNGTLVGDPGFDDTTELVEFLVESAQYGSGALKAFHEFVEQRSFDELSPRLCDAQRAFMVLNAGVPLSDYTGAEVASAGEFIAEFGTADDKARFATIIVDHLGGGDLSEDEANQLTLLGGQLLEGKPQLAAELYATTLTQLAGDLEKRRPAKQLECRWRVAQTLASRLPANKDANDMTVVLDLWDSLRDPVPVGAPQQLLKLWIDIESPEGAEAWHARLELLARTRGSEKMLELADVLLSTGQLPLATVVNYVGQTMPAQDRAAQELAAAIFLNEATQYDTDDQGALAALRFAADVGAVAAPEYGQLVHGLDSRTSLQPEGDHGSPRAEEILRLAAVGSLDAPRAQALNWLQNLIRYDVRALAAHARSSRVGPLATLGGSAEDRDYLTAVASALATHLLAGRSATLLDTAVRADSPNEQEVYALLLGDLFAKHRKAAREHLPLLVYAHMLRTLTLPVADSLFKQALDKNRLTAAKVGAPTEENLGQAAVKIDAEVKGVSGRKVTELWKSFVEDNTPASKPGRFAKFLKGRGKQD